MSYSMPIEAFRIVRESLERNEEAAALVALQGIEVSFRLLAAGVRSQNELSKAE